MKFPSEKDKIIGTLWWGSIIILIGGGITLFIMKPYFTNDRFPILFYLISFLFIVAGFLMIFSWYTTYYIIGDDRLLIRGGPLLHKSILFHTIHSVGKSNSAYSGPALSLNRIEIVYGKHYRYTVISPTNQSYFLKLLQQKCPKATFHI